MFFFFIYIFFSENTIVNIIAKVEIIIKNISYIVIIIIINNFYIVIKAVTDFFWRYCLLRENALK